MKSGTDTSLWMSLLQGKVGTGERMERRGAAEAASRPIHSMALLAVLTLRFGVARKNSRHITHLC